LTGTFTGVIHITALPDGSFHFTLTTVEEVSTVFDDPSLPTYTGKITSWEGSNLNPQNNFTATFADHFTVTGTDGSRVAGHTMGHVTLQPDGSVTVEFDRFWLTCP
jgi:hypothetical protein